MYEKYYMKIVLIIFLVLFLFGCGKLDQKEEEREKTNLIFSCKIRVDQLTYQTPIYILWIEDQITMNRQYFFVCDKLTIVGALSGIALPYTNCAITLDTNDNIDAVTAATHSFAELADFTIEGEIEDINIVNFKVYFEINYSWDYNEWFPKLSDDFLDRIKYQPAILYQAEVDLSSGQKEYTMQAIGWTPNEHNENIIHDTPKCVLNEELKYISERKNPDGSFGGPYPENDPINKPATRNIESITISIE